MLILYRVFFPFVFLFFLPGLLWKLIRRPGFKKTYAERFGVFFRDRVNELKNRRGAIWLHAVSVGETNLALTVLNQWVREAPGANFILSTTTTTAQEIARKKSPPGTTVIFCPIDSSLFVRRTLNLIQPSMLVIFETELWPNLVRMSRARGIRTVLVNTRISDRSFRGYRRFRAFFAPVLNAFDAIGVQTATDRERIETIAPETAGRISVTGNIKFDQTPPAGPGFDFSPLFGSHTQGIIVTASTHFPEEPLILSAFEDVRKSFPNAKLVLVPRHAERGGEIEKLLEKSPFRFHRRSRGGAPAGEIDILLADTTGELASFLKSADIVIMGKTFAGNDEGQNIIEPAVMGKPVLCGPKLKNFRQALAALEKNHAVRIVTPDSALGAAIADLLSHPETASSLGEAAKRTMLENRGALRRTLDLLENNRIGQ